MQPTNSIQRSLSFVLWLISITASIALAAPTETIQCSRPLNSILIQLNHSANNIIYSDTLIQPWMRVLNTDIPRPLDSAINNTDLRKILEPYGLTAEHGPQNSQIIYLTNKPKDSTVITGQVVIRDTGLAIDSGQVAIEQHSNKAVIDEHGCFLLSGLRQGDYTLSLHTNEQYRKIDKTLSVPSNQHLHVNIEIEKPPAPTMQEVYIYANPPNSIDAKRHAHGLIELIQKREMLALPAGNPAESLQHLSGVSISRQNGEGRTVIVRGISGDFNMVTLNGRTMPSSSLLFNGGGDSSSREFDFSNISLNSINTIDVFKTSKANMSSGGIGATVNLKTQRPLDGEELAVSISAKAVTDAGDRGALVSPYLEGSINFISYNEKFGVYLGYSLQEHRNSVNGAYVSYWETQEFDGSILQSAKESEYGPRISISNPPRIGQLYSMPSDLRYTQADRESEALNSLLTLQFKPSAKLTGTLDFLYSQKILFENRSELSIWMDTYKSDLIFDTNTVTTPTLYWEDRREKTPRDIGLALQQHNVNNSTSSLGLNIEWQLSPSVSLMLDGHHSHSDSTPERDFGNWINIGMGANVSGGQGVDFRPEIPILVLDFEDHLLNDNGLLDKNEIGSSVLQNYYDTQKTYVDQIKIDGLFNINQHSQIDFGIETRRVENRSLTIHNENLLAGDWGIDKPGDIPEKYLTLFNYPTAIDDSMDPFFSNASNNKAHRFNDGVKGDAAAIGQHLSSTGGTPWSTPRNNGTTRLVHENIIASYLQYQLASETLNYPVTLSAGLRYEKTKVTSISKSPLPSHAVWKGPNDISLSYSTAAETSLSSDYEYVLPNIDLSVALTKNIKSRLSYSKSIARPRYQHLKATTGEFANPTQPTILTAHTPSHASGGNPYLRPLLSNNYDASIEWYFHKQSYVSVTYFEKHIDNYIGLQTINKSVLDLRDVTAGPRARDAAFDLEAINLPVTAKNLFTMMTANQLDLPFDSIGVSESSIQIEITADTNDPPMIFAINQPINNQSATIVGLELAAECFIKTLNLLIQANYTKVDSNRKYNNHAPPDSFQFALADISDSANVRLMYAKDRFYVSLAYNRRDTFLNHTAINSTEPSYTAPHSQLDMKLNYTLSQSLSISLEGINITGKDTRQYGRTPAQFNRYEATSPRYLLGIKYSL